MNNKGIIVCAVLAGFFGGLMSNGIFAEAQSNYPKVVSAENFQLVDNNGKRVGSWANCGSGSPCLNFFDVNGNVRLQLGIYNAAGEAGLPFVILNSNGGDPKAILRLVGQNEAPVLVMKNNNMDKMVMGLDFANSSEPFLAKYDNAGSKSMVFGKY
jgi:hypothetical protein